MFAAPRYLNRRNLPTQKNIDQKALIVDQDRNRSHQMFFLFLSTIESIILYHKSKSHQNYNRMFKDFDRIGSISKDISQLKRVLQSQSLLFHSSKKIFEQDYPRSSWALSKPFGLQQSQQFLNYSLSVFESVQDVKSLKVVRDALAILRGSADNISSQQVGLKVVYSEQEKQKHKKELFQNGVKASQEMDNRKYESANFRIETKSSQIPQGVEKQQKWKHTQTCCNTFFYKLLSTLQKMVQHYEPKSIVDLQNQPHSQILIVKSLQKEFESNNGWQLPTFLDENEVNSLFSNALSVFVKARDERSNKLAEDVRSILKGKFNGLNAEQIAENLKVQYSEEKKWRIKELFKNGLFADSEMDKRQVEVSSINNVNQLNAHINGQHGRRPKDKKFESMDIKETKMSETSVSFSYIAFLSESTATKFTNGNFNLGNAQFQQIRDAKQLQRKRSNLLQRRYDYVVPFVSNQNNIQRCQAVRRLSKLKP